MDERVYKIGELAEVTGITPRTIRYYTSEGLLPSPDARGAHALYGAEHLRRLRLIGRLKESYLPLGEIKATLDSLGPDQIAALLVQLDQAVQPTSASDYISHVLAARPQRQSIAEPSAEYATNPDAFTDQQVVAAPSAALRAVDLPARPAPLSLGRAESAQPQPVQGEATGLLHRLLPRRRALHAERESLEEERWRRVSLAPGVELHIREPLLEKARERIERLVAQARELFANER